MTIRPRFQKILDGPFEVKKGEMLVLSIAGETIGHYDVEGKLIDQHAHDLQRRKTPIDPKRMAEALRLTYTNVLPVRYPTDWQRDAEYLIERYNGLRP